MRRKFIRTTFLLFRFLSLVFILVISEQVLAHPSPPPAPADDRNAALQIFAQVNQWRVQNGLWPLRWNNALEQMAIAQADYIYRNNDIVSSSSGLTVNGWDVWHIDGQGRNPFQRAAASPVNWPDYNNVPAQIVIGENAVQNSLAGAVKWWQGSQVHKCTALDPRFRESAVAALPYSDGSYLIYQDFGSRPGVLTALLDPTTATLYLSTELVSYDTNFPASGISTAQLLIDTACSSGSTSADAGRSLPNDLQIAIFDDNNAPIVTAMPYQETVTLPSGAPSLLTIVYSSQSFDRPIVDIVDLSNPENLAVFPNTLSLLPKATVAPTITATVSPSPTSTAFPTIEASQAPGGQTSTPTLTPNSSAATVGPNALTLVYKNTTLYLYNSGTKTLDLTSLSLGNATLSITTDRWSRLYPFPATKFVPGDCLAIQDLSQKSDTAPSGCKYGPLSEVDLSPGQVFWQQDSFTVSEGDTVLATCSAKQCGVPWQ